MATFNQNACQRQKTVYQFFMTVQIYEFYIKWIFPDVMI